MEQRVCLECGKQLMGRVDKKFCNTRCRNDYNNAQYGKTTTYIRRINRILKRNRQILEQHTPREKSIKVPKKTLLKDGFSFEYFTHTYTTKSDKTYHFCYEYGYLDLGDNYFALVYNKSYDRA